MYKFCFDRRTVEKRILKYIIVSLVIAIAASNVPKQSLSTQEVLTIAMIGGCIFAIVDMYSPTLSSRIQ